MHLVLLFAGMMQSANRPDHATSRAYNVALGVGCEHCHVDGDFANAAKPTLDFARRMERMVRGINEGPLRDRVGVTCWSCHRGKTIPARLPRPAWESIENAHKTDFEGGREGLGLAMGVYSASLGVDCSHCHIAGDWTNASKRPHQTVNVMSGIFDVIPTFFEGSVRQPRTQCYMCHQGRTLVERHAPPL